MTAACLSLKAVARLIAATLFVCASISARPAVAQDWPQNAVKLVIPFGAGSSVVVLPDGTFFAGESDSTNTGWTLGGGLEYAFTNNLTAKIEGLYVNLDSGDRAIPGAVGLGLGVADSSDVEFAVVRAGLNFKFGTY